jgi:hypothetical protein
MHNILDARVGVASAPGRTHDFFFAESKFGSSLACKAIIIAATP